MSNEIIHINKDLRIPLFGVDFIGIIDRGTNIIELKCNTKCNLKCKYCFVKSGDYETDFIVNTEYLLSQVENVVKIKGNYNIEIHIAPYGETLLYPSIFELISNLWKIKGIETISMQTNGLLLTKHVIKKLEAVNLTRINLSLNSLNEDLASYLCKTTSYNMNKLLENIKLILDSNINLLIAPVWFPRKNDKDIEQIIKFIVKLRKNGYSEKQIQIGIQKYLIYKTGRKLSRVRPKTWNYFYKQLSRLEKLYHIKLKLGPKDFGIHKRKSVSTLNLKKNDMIRVKIVSKGR